MYFYLKSTCASSLPSKMPVLDEILVSYMFNFLPKSSRLDIEHKGETGLRVRMACNVDCKSRYRLDPLIMDPRDM